VKIAVLQHTVGQQFVAILCVGKSNSEDETP
jgi:hypothetical protein